MQQQWQAPVIPEHETLLFGKPVHAVAHAPSDIVSPTEILLNSLRVGLLLFNPAAQVMYYNDAAAAVIDSRPWLRLDGNKIKCQASVCAELDHRIALIFQKPAEPFRSPVILSGPKSTDTLLLSLTATNGSVDKPSAVIGVLVDPLQQHSPDVSALQQLYQLTNAEYKVTALIADGLDYKEIAIRRNVAVATVRTYTKSIFNKLGVDSRAGVVHKVHSTTVPLNLLQSI